MKTYNLKLKQEQKWLQSNTVFFSRANYAVIESGGAQILKANEATICANRPKDQSVIEAMKSFGTALDEIKALWAQMDLLSQHVSHIHNNSDYLIFCFPTLKTCTKLNGAYVGQMEISTVLSHASQILDLHTEIKNKLTPFLPMYSHVQITPNPVWDTKSAIDKIKDFLRQDAPKIQKEIAKIKAQLDDKSIVVETKNAENSFRNKTSWAIFARHPSSNSTHVGGYLDKHKAEGDISTARLFDSDVGALKTAKAMRLQTNTYDIVEVEIQFKKRTNLVPGFHNNAISEIEAIIEKEKIEDMFESFGVDKIEAKLSEIKQKNKNKL